MSKLKLLIKEFIDILEEEEESDNGTVFRPVRIHSCRVMKSKRISEIILEIKENL